MTQFSNDEVENVIAGCDPNIIPIFPLRFAITESALINMLDDTTTPATPTNIDDLDHHELLRIRRGYVYVFADGHFHVFQFETQSDDENGCMYDPKVEKPSSAAYQFTKYEWANGVQGKWKPSKKSYPYLFVPKDTPKAWVAYSEYRWPYRFVFEAETNPEFRNSIMTEIDLTTREGDFCAPIDELEQRVPAFRKDSVDFTATDYSVANAIRATDVEIESSSSVIVCQNSKEKGVLVALHDPIGELKDIQGLMSIHCATYANYVAEHQYPLTMGQLVKNYADNDKVSTKSLVFFDGPLQKEFASEYDKLLCHAQELEASQKKIEAHWANKVAQTGTGSLLHLLDLSETVANNYTFKSYPEDHIDTVIYWILCYVRMCSSDAKSLSLSETLNSMFDPSDVKSPNASVLKTVSGNLQKALGFMKPILQGGTTYQSMLAPAIHAMFTIYGTEVVRASKAAGDNATKQLTDIMFQSKSVPYANQDELTEAFKNLMTKEGYSNSKFPIQTESLGSNVHASHQMTPTVEGPKPINLVEFHAQIDLNLDSEYIKFAKRSNSFDLGSNGVGAVAAGLSLYATLDGWNNTRRNASEIGDIVSNPSTQLTAAFADAVSSVHAIAAGLVKVGDSGVGQKVLEQVFKNNPAFTKAVASNARSFATRAISSKSLAASAKIAGGIGVAISVGLAIEGYKRGDNAMMAGNSLMAIAGFALLFVSSGPLVFVLLAVVLAGFIISLFAYDDAELWVLNGFWGTSDNYWEVERPKQVIDQIDEAKVLAYENDPEYKNIKDEFDKELAYFIDINSNLSIKDATQKDGIIEIHCATLRTVEDLSRLEVKVVYLENNYKPYGAIWKDIPDITPEFKEPGIALAHIPDNPVYYNINSFNVAAELERVPNGSFEASKQIRRKDLW